MFYPKITPQFVLCVVGSSSCWKFEIMLKQYCLSERVINHQVDKSSGHCWRVMSVFLTFNTFRLLLVRWIISTLMMVQKYSVCHQSRWLCCVSFLQFEYFSASTCSEQRFRALLQQPEKYNIIRIFMCCPEFWTFTFQEIKMTCLRKHNTKCKLIYMTESLAKKTATNCCYFWILS